MKHLILILLFLCTTNFFGQEICNNGIDDDGDTYIDLNDTTDCSCILGTPPFPSVSLIPNPSFELKDCCPTSYSGFGSNYTCATSWSTAITNSTPDYLNRCNYVSQALTTASLTSFPDGQACSGVMFCQDYKEYIAACLTAPLIAGTEYRLRFNVASININPQLNNCIVGFNNSWGPTDIAIYGKKTCSNIPNPAALTNSCLSVADTSWSVLGTLSYTPSATWNIAYITFTPTTNINAFAIGSPCNLPAFYPNFSLNNADCLPYFVFDNLILNTTPNIGFVNISATGHYCTNNLALKANIVSSVASSSIQWYHNGVAISGATNLTYAVPSGTAGLGNYKVMLDNVGTCYSSTNYVVTSDASILSVNSRTICLNASGVLLATSIAVSNYTWSTGATTKSITVNPNTTTVYTVSSVYGSCIAQATSTVTVLFGASAPLTISASSATVCPNTPVVLTGGGYAYQYWWNAGSPSSTLTPITVTPSVTTTYSFNGAIGLCGTSKTITINVIPNPTITVSLSTPSICPGGTETITASGATTYSWSTGATTSTISTSTAGTYTVIGLTNGCTNTKTISVAVTANPTVAVSNVTTCAGTSKILTASGASTYSWSTGATTSTISTSTAGTYTIIGTTNGCIDTKTVSVTVTANPTVAVSNATTCAGTPKELTASGASTYSWSTGAATSTISTSTAGVYTVTGTNSGCTDTKTVSLTATAIPTIAVTNATICSGSSVLTVTGASTYSWSTGATTSTISTAGVYTVTGTTNGCTDTKTVSLTVSANPTIAVTNATICSGTSFVLTASGASSYSWSTGAATSTISTSIAGVYTVTGTNSGCTDTKTVSLTVTTSPTIAVTNATICIGTPAVLTASGASTYSWNTGATTSTISTSAAGTYTVIGSIGYCQHTATSSVYFVNPISYSITADTLICLGESSTLISTSSNSTTVIQYNIQGPEFASPFYYFTNSIIVTPSVTSTYTIICQPNLQPCTSMSTITINIEMCTDIKSIKNPILAIVNPNPVNEFLNITLSNPLINNNVIELYDMTGKLLTREPLVNLTTKLSMLNLSNGIYMLRIISIKNQQFIKVIKE